MGCRRALAASERARLNEVERLVAELEQKSDAEIVPIVVAESHDYAFYEFRLAILAGLFVFLGLLFALHPLESTLKSLFWDYSTAHLVLVTGLVTFSVMLVVYLLVNLPCVDRLIVPKRVQGARVHERALRAFVESRVSHTPNRMGLLIFVSLLERRIEFLADRGLKEIVPADIWPRLVEQTGKKIQEKGAIDGILHGIREVGSVLSECCPPTGAPSKCLADDLTVLER